MKPYRFIAQELPDITVTKVLEGKKVAESWLCGCKKSKSPIYCDGSHAHAEATKKE